MIIVLSSPVPVGNEHQIIQQLFDAGLDFFQVYKPDFTEEEVENYIQQIPSQYQGKISRHAAHFKFHSLEELDACKENYDYAFLSPVFDSISKVNYQGKYKMDDLKAALRNTNKKIVALGGIDEDKIDAVKDAGFTGIALLGAVWKSDSPVDKYKLIKKKWLEKELVY
jgi:thiamine-phosphate pyrophosphorylase